MVRRPRGWFVSSEASFSANDNTHHALALRNRNINHREVGLVMVGKKHESSCVESELVIFLFFVSDLIVTVVISD